MARISTHRLFLILGALILIFTLACGEEAAPTAVPTAASTPDAAANQALVQEAVAAALAASASQQGASGEDVQKMIEDAVAASVEATAPEGASPDEIEAMVQSAIEAATSSTGAQPTPAAMPEPAVPPVGMMEPTGHLFFSVAELGSPAFVLKNQDFQNNKFLGTTTHEMMFASDTQGIRIPRLVQQLEVDPSGLIYTFHLQQGVQFHKNWGEFTADDFLFNIDGLVQEGTVHGSSGDIQRIYLCEGCALTKLDDYTVQLQRPTPTFEIAWRSWQPDTGLSFNSKLQYDTLGEERANFEAVGTGSWDLVDFKSGEYRHMEAVQDHWRQTPQFAEMTWLDIAEESTRLANFIVGRLDTALFSAESVQAIRSDPPDDVKFMTLSDAFMIRIMPTGSQYFTDYEPRLAGEVGNSLGGDAGDCTPAYISCDRDESSDEWEKAKKVRLALQHSVDRQKLINNIAFGEGQPVYLLAWMGHEARMRQFGLDELEYEYDVDKAKQLLVEAGYPGGGFEVDMCLVVRPGLAAEAIQAGQAVAGMWAQIGVDTNQINLPHSAFRPTLVARTARCMYTRSDNPQVEPIRYWSTVFSAANPGYNQGLEHPTLQRIIAESQALLDDDERWAKQAEGTRWFFDNALDMPLYTKPQVFPLGPRLDEWGAMPRVVDWLNNWEYAQHR
jgi:ABC-type transport system substrate-binding protein